MFGYKFKSFGFEHIMMATVSIGGAIIAGALVFAFNLQHQSIAWVTIASMAVLPTLIKLIERKKKEVE